MNKDSRHKEQDFNRVNPPPPVTAEGIIGGLQIAVDMSIENGDEENEKSWGYETGILITRKMANDIIELLRNQSLHTTSVLRGVMERLPDDSEIKHESSELCCGWYMAKERIAAILTAEIEKLNGNNCG